MSALIKIEAVDTLLPMAPDGTVSTANDKGPVVDDGALGHLRSATDLSACLMPLLRGLGWLGDPRHVAEALPHFIDSLDVTSFRNAMANLQFRSRPIRLSLKDVDPRLMPCLFVPDDSRALVLLGEDPDGMGWLVYDPAYHTERIVVPERHRGTLYLFSRLSDDDDVSANKKLTWFEEIRGRFRPLVYQTLGITLVLNLLALATPLFVMAVYDRVVSTGSMSTLGYFGIGVAIALVCDQILRAIRSRILGYVGARLDNILGNAIFQKLLYLPPSFVERATIGSQVARIKDFETIREFFSGPIALVFFELPFVFIFVVVIAILGGPVAFISVGLIALYGLMSLVTAPFISQGLAKASRAGSRKQELVVEGLSSMRAVKYTGSEATWLERYRELSSKSALFSFQTSQIAAVSNTVSHIIMVGAGLGTVALGVHRVLAGDMTVGGLVASMILVWRVLAPLQTGFVSLTRLNQVTTSVHQINNLMKLKGERNPGDQIKPIPPLAGRVTFSRVSLRYAPEMDPALVGVSFEIQPGETVVVVGANGSGKSTIIKLLAGLYTPQAGNIRIDNSDVRQMNIIELRHTICYVPQVAEFFYGTIAQNLRLAQPSASDQELRDACRQAGILEDIDALEQGSGKWKRRGFEVRIGDGNSTQMPTSLTQGLNLARGYLKNARIMLFDEPGQGLDWESDQRFMENIRATKGKKTVFIVTHRPSHLKLADKIIWLDSGHLRAAGRADEVRKHLPKEFL